MADTQEPVAVLGIGVMGQAMAAGMVGAAIPTMVWNRAPEGTRDLAGLGGGVAETTAPW
jgi:3-hydroxyisobutyrate dehydrogenase-like beta-hydroxyacid dehydrogenase